MHIDQLDTPVAIIDLDKMESNIHRFQRYLDQHGIANHPHIKTHKIPEVAHLQIAAGAAGISCQKLGEAEVMVQAGIKNIFIPYNLMGAAKMERLAHLSKRANISVAADSEYTVKALSQAGQQANQEISVLIEFDSGKGRCGVRRPDQATDLARLIARTPGLHFGGLMTYPNSEQTDSFVSVVKEQLADHGLDVERVSGGGTPVMWQVHNHPQITEHRAGTYVYGDRTTIRDKSIHLEECALTVITTVVSRPTEDACFLDGGSKTFSSDTMGLEGHGLILEYPEAQIRGFSEEHGHVDISHCIDKPEVGERVTVIPNHCCVVSNLFEEVVGVRNGEVEVVWPVACRGRLT